MKIHRRPNSKTFLWININFHFLYENDKLIILINFCLLGGFLGDIALPNVKYETEWRQQYDNKDYAAELEKYRDEMLNEGLQIEEEGLTSK